MLFPIDGRSSCRSPTGRRASCRVLSREMSSCMTKEMRVSADPVSAVTCPEGSSFATLLSLVAVWILSLSDTGALRLNLEGQCGPTFLNKRCVSGELDGNHHIWCLPLAVVLYRSLLLRCFHLALRRTMPLRAAAVEEGCSLWTACLVLNHCSMLAWDMESSAYDTGTARATAARQSVCTRKDAAGYAKR